MLTATGLLDVARVAAGCKRPASARQILLVLLSTARPWSPSQLSALIDSNIKSISSTANELERVGAITCRWRPSRSKTPRKHLPAHDRHRDYKLLHRLQVFVDQIRRPTSLHALKLYMLLLTLRENHANFAAISYEKIMSYTLMRREEVSVAIQLLVATQLCRLLSDEELPRRPDDPKHNRYYICGLVAS